MLSVNALSGDLQLTPNANVVALKCTGVRNGWTTVKAEAIEGKLALHRSVACFNNDEPVLSDTCFTVTHLPTGCAVHTMIEGKDRAQQFLSAVKSLDWAFEKKEECTKVSNQVLELKRVILGRTD